MKAKKGENVGDFDVFECKLFLFLCFLYIFCSSFKQAFFFTSFFYLLFSFFFFLQMAESFGGLN